MKFGLRHPVPVGHHPDSTIDVSDVLKWVAPNQHKVRAQPFRNSTPFVLRLQELGRAAGCNSDCFKRSEPNLDEVGQLLMHRETGNDERIGCVRSEQEPGSSDMLGAHKIAPLLLVKAKATKLVFR